MIKRTLFFLEGYLNEFYTPLKKKQGVFDAVYEVWV